MTYTGWPDQQFKIQKFLFQNQKMIRIFFGKIRNLSERRIFCKVIDT